MKKKYIEKTNRKNLTFDIIFYGLIIFIGLFLIKISSINRINKFLIIECVLYIIGFISIIMYVINRRNKDYEFLEFGFINIVTSLFIQINESYHEPGVILGNAFIIYSSLYLVSKVYNSYKLYNDKNINYIFKLSIGLVISFIGIYLSIVIFKYYLLSDYILGCYYLLFGIISILEPLIELLLRNPKLDNKLKSILKYKKAENHKKMILREIPNKKISKMNK